MPPSVQDQSEPFPGIFFFIFAIILLAYDARKIESVSVNTWPFSSPHAVEGDESELRQAEKRKETSEKSILVELSLSSSLKANPLQLYPQWSLSRYMSQ